MWGPKAGKMKVFLMYLSEILLHIIFATKQTDVCNLMINRVVIAWRKVQFIPILLKLDQNPQIECFWGSRSPLFLQLPWWAIIIDQRPTTFSLGHAQRVLCWRECDMNQRHSTDIKQKCSWVGIVLVPGGPYYIFPFIWPLIKTCLRSYYGICQKEKFNLQNRVPQLSTSSGDFCNSCGHAL